MYLIIQQGGSSNEFYPELYDTEEDAERAILGIKANTYEATDPIKVPEALAKAIAGNPEAEGGLLDLLDNAIMAAACEQFSDLEPEECEECGGGIDPNEEGCWQCQLS